MPKRKRKTHWRKPEAYSYRKKRRVDSTSDDSSDLEDDSSSSSSFSSSSEDMNRTTSISSIASLSAGIHSEALEIMQTGSDVDFPSGIGLEGFMPLHSSSPIMFATSESSSNCSSSSEAESSDDSDTPLYLNSDMTASQFSNKFSAIVKRHRISDIGAKSMLDLITEALPCPSKTPAISSLNSESTCELKDAHVMHLAGSYYIMNAKPQIDRLITKYPSIFDLNTFVSLTSSHDGIYRDVYDGNRFKVHFSDTLKLRFLYVILNSDGVAPPFQSRTYKIWPVTMCILNLSPLERRKAENIVLCALYYGRKMPNFDMLMSSATNLIESISFQHGSFTVKIKVINFLADLPAKASCLNIMPFHSYYGCSLCDIRGHYSRTFRKMIFPLAQQSRSELRSETEHAAHASQGTARFPVMGVRGESPLKKIMSIPTDVGLDTMHLVYHGVTKKFFSYLVNKKLVDIDRTNDILESSCLPLFEKRKPRAIDRACHWKASEWKNFLLYFSVVCLHHSENTPSEFILINLILSTAVYLLTSNGVSETDITAAEELILMFQKFVNIYLGRANMVYSVHALVHLPEQVRRFGPLWVTSASVFESAFGIMKSFVKGSRNEGKQIIERFLRYQMNNTDNQSDTTTRLPDKNGVFCSGKCLPISIEILNEYGIESTTARQVHKITVNHVGYTSFSYSRKGHSASHYATVFFDGDDKKRFLRINHIVVDRDNELLCLCRFFTSSKYFPTLDFSDIPDINVRVLDEHCPVRLLKKGKLGVVSAKHLLSHFILINSDGNTYGIPHLNDFEHN